MAKRPLKRAERIEVFYSEKHWGILKKFRAEAMKTMEILNEFHLHSIVYGSIARGDVSEKSDVDVFVPNPQSSFIIETTLEQAEVPVSRRVVVQATPHYAVKGYLEIDKQHSVSFPLLKLRPLERDFYKFGGEVSLLMLRKDTRTLGVDKRLMLIEPTKKGHVESSIVGQEENITRLLGISIETVLDRVHALLRRDEIGRTGVFIERELSPEETFEMVLKKLVDQNPAVRRRLKLYGK
jgi:predicted nucleotidyltransferase